MKVMGSAVSGGPASGRSVPLPTAPQPRPGSDIVSRLEAAHARVSPLGQLPAPGDLPARAVYVPRPDNGKRPRRGGGRYDRVQIAAMYRRGMSGPDIATALGCRTATVYTALREAAVPLRKTVRAARKAAGGAP